MECRKCGREIPEIDGAGFCPYCGTRQERTVTRRKRPNGAGCVIKTKSGKYKAIITVGIWTDNDGKIHQARKTRTFEKRTDALLAIAGMKIETEGVKVKDLTLRELYDLYTAGYEYKQLSKSQRDKMGYAWKRLGPLEFRGIGTLNVSDIETLIEEQTVSYYPARDIKVLLSHLYELAIKRDVVQTNRTEYVDIPFDAPKAKRECWTQDEVDALWEDYKTHQFTGYILIMCYAGLRYGELATIQLENINLEERYMVGGIKTEAGIDREIPIHTRIVPVVQRCMTGRKARLLEMNEDHFYSAYWDAIRRAGLRELPPHTCRHYFFSRLTSAGVQGGIIAEVGGHASYLTTLKNYVRVPIEDKRAAVDRI